MQRHIADAERSIQAAVRVCREARKVSGPERRRAERAARSLGRLLHGLNNVDRLTPLYNLDDPDLSEDAASRWREERLPDQGEEIEAPALEAGEAPQPEPEAVTAGGGE